ncbi:hypothetical protein V501_03179 [Pseudogymnoascus sp. VKM F-4519 (FW-2642)]|nr:hypothetical protein V501_03179 [Pseudogymnoascus sp. VKM F-4519 (FW-2642)]
MLSHTLHTQLSTALQKPILCVLIATSSILAILILRSLLRDITSPLRDIPGPFLARYTRLWKLREIYKGAFQETNIELHRKHGDYSFLKLDSSGQCKLLADRDPGPIVRIAPNEYSIDDPDAVKVIYGLGSQFIKSPWYTASGDPDPHGTPDLFSDRNPTRHAASRRKVASAYSMTALAQLEPLVDECYVVLRDRFIEFADRGKVVDMAHWMQCYAFDVIGEITVGKRFGFLDQGDDIDGIMAAISQYLSYGAMVGVYAEFHRFAAKLLSFLPQKQGGGMAAMGKFANAQVQQRLSKTAAVDAGDDKHPNQKGDFLSKMLNLHHENPEKITLKDVFLTCITNIGAGSDTTSISLCSVFYHLCKHPEVAQRLRAEIDEKVAAGELDDPITFKQAQSMPYLQAVLKEALRMHPATGLPLGRVVPSGGAAIAGRAFPAGSIVGVNSWVAHANQDVWGPDAAVFRPERWLVGKEEYNVLDRYYFTVSSDFRLSPPIPSPAAALVRNLYKRSEELTWRYDYSLGWALGHALGGILVSSRCPSWYRN